jgi:hypothetical protein
MPEAAAILARLDAIMAELAELRAEVVASMPVSATEGNCLDADDLADGNLLDTHAAAARFGIPADCLRRWARETRNTAGAIGRRKGGRWLVSIQRVQRRINGG